MGYTDNNFEYILPTALIFPLWVYESKRMKDVDVERYFLSFVFCVFQEKTVKQGETLVEQMKATQEKSLHQTSELHAKELEVLQSQVNKLKEELSSSRDKSQELEKLVSELQAYKEQAQVSTDCHMYRCFCQELVGFLKVLFV